MKKILKVLSLVLALVMCFTMVFTTAVSAEETTTPTLTIVGQTVEAGAETATINVVASDFTTIAGAHFVVELGSLTDVVVDNEFAHYDEAANAVSFVKEAEWNNGECLGFTDGTILTITVTAPAEAGSYEVAFGATGKDVDFCTAALEEVAVELVAGAVVVEPAEPVGPTLDETLTLTRTINIDATVGIQYVFELPAKYVDYYITVERNVCDDLNNFAFVATEKTLTEADAFYTYEPWYYFLYDGIAMYELNMPITATIHCFDADGNEFVSNPIVDTIADLAKSNYNKTSKENAKKAMTDLLNLGSEAQLYFAPEGSDLAGVALPNADFVGTPTEDYGTLNTVNTTSGSKKITPILELKASPSLYYTIQVDTSYAAEDLTIDISYNDPKNGKTSLVAKASDDVINSEWASYGYYYVSFSKVTLYSGNQDVTITVSDANGVVVSNVYSVETFVAANIDNAKAGAVLEAVARFGYSTRVYAGIQ